MSRRTQRGRSRSANDSKRLLLDMTAPTKPVLPHTRAGAALMFGPEGLQWAPNNFTRSDASAAVPGIVGAGGSLPVGWSMASGGTVAREIVGVGRLDDGRPYLDLRVYGTNTTGGYVYPDLYFQTGSDATGPGGRFWTASVWVGLIAGSFANFGAPAGSLVITEVDNKGANISGTSTSSSRMTGAFERKTATRSQGHRNTNGVRCYLSLQVPDGATVDATIRICDPQLEAGLVATEYKRPFGGQLYHGPRFVHNPYNLAPWGLLLEEGRTNYLPMDNLVLNINDWTVTGSASATLMPYDDAAVQIASHLRNPGLAVTSLKVDNSAGTTDAIVLSKVALQSPEHAVASAYVRTEAPGIVAISGAGTPGEGFELVLPDRYTRIFSVVSGVAPANARIGIRVKAGQVVYIMLPQYENGTYPTSVIPSAPTVGGVRAPDMMGSILLPSFRDMTLAMDYMEQALDPTGVTLVIGNGSGGYDGDQYTVYTASYDEEVTYAKGGTQVMENSGAGSYETMLFYTARLQGDYWSVYHAGVRDDDLCPPFQPGMNKLSIGSEAARGGTATVVGSKCIGKIDLRLYGVNDEALDVLGQRGE